VISLWGDGELLQQGWSSGYIDRPTIITNSIQRFSIKFTLSSSPGFFDLYLK